MVFGHVWFLGLVCASDRAHVFFVGLWSCLDADACPWSCASTYPSRCASTCSLWTAKKICPLPNFVLCSVSSPLGATFTNGENDHG